MASRSLSLWLTLSALILGVAGCTEEPTPPLPPSKDLPDATRSKVEVDSTRAKANGKEVVSITVTVVKADGVALADRTVRLEVTGEGVTVTPASAKTDAQGVMKATLVSTRAGTKRVTASVDTGGEPVVLGTRPTIDFGPSKLIFTQQPGNSSTTGSLGEVKVEIADEDGMAAAVGSPPVTVSLTQAGVTLDGTRTVNPTSGVASFTDLKVAQEGTGYTLTATAEGLTDAVSNAFNIVDNMAPAKPALSQGTTTVNSIVVQWTAVGDDGTAGAATSQELRYSTTPIVTDADFAAATLVTTGAPQAAGSAEQATLSGLTPSTNYYVALQVTDNAGNSMRSDTLTVSTANPAVVKLAFTTQPVNGTAGTTMATVRVSLLDASDKPVVSATSAVTLTLLNGPTLPAVTVNASAGVATFSNLRIDTAGTGYQFEANSSGLTAVRSSAFNIQAGAAKSLELTGLPASVTAGASNTLEVTVKDEFGNVATGYRGTVRFTSSDANAVLPGDHTFTAGDAGTASMTVELRTAGSRSVTVTDTVNATLTDNASTTVTPGNPSKLVFLTQPANGTVRTTLGTVSVALHDAYDNATTATSPTVSVGLSGGNAQATLSGTLNVAPVNGVAEFTGLSIDQEGTDFHFAVSAQGMTSATSSAFTITDDLAPNTVVIAATASSTTSVTVTWTAVGDDGDQGKASSYELRYASTAITTEAEFNAATLFTIPAPKAAGAAETATVTGLNLSTDHHFALKVIDGAGNFSRSASVKVAGQGQAGNIVISEFSALGAEFIELHNPTAADIDVRGYKFRNAAGVEADIRAPNDPNGTGTSPVVVPAGGFLHGIPNPTPPGTIPAGTGFIVGAPGTFSLVDTGDSLTVLSGAGTMEDKVDFSTFITNPNTPLTAAAFVGLAGSSTQLDPEQLTATANDTALNWCVSFYPAGSKASRVTNTAGAANGSCKVAVLNEVFFRAIGFDERNTFVEVAGPGGSVIGGAKILDVEGKNPGAGNLNTDGQTNAGNADGEYTFPAGTRIPVDGFLIVADVDPANSTLVPNFVDGVDLKARDMDLENDSSESVQLVSASGSLLDALGHDSGGAALDATTTPNGLAMFEAATALTTTAANIAGSSLARAESSVDTDNNRNDFHLDPSPTPGLPNDAVNLTVTGMTPDDGPAASGASGIVVTGTDFATGLRAQFGNLPAGPCTVASSTSATCSAMANPGGAVASVNVTFNNHANISGSPFVLTSGFTYTGKENETGSALEADFCTLVGPTTLTVASGQVTAQISGRIKEVGVTEAPGGAAGILAEVGYGTNGTNPTASNSWKFFPASFSEDEAAGDVYVGTFTAPSVATTYSYTVRFSQDNGMKWTYCDLDGAGSDPGADFLHTNNLGALTVTP